MAARDFLHDERASRPVILALVVGAHLAAFFIDWPEKIVIYDPSGPRTRLLLIPAMPREQRLPLPVTIAPMTEAITPPPPPGLAPTDLSSAATAPISSAMAPPPDWKQSGADAAADAARKEYRALGPRPIDPQIKAPRSPFKPPPKHKHGELGEDALENPVLWLSEDCYIRFENRKLPLDDPFRSIPMSLCTFPVGKLEPKGDLFEHLRKPQPVP